MFGCVAVCVFIYLYGVGDVRLTLYEHVKASSDLYICKDQISCSTCISCITLVFVVLDNRLNVMITIGLHHRYCCRDISNNDVTALHENLFENNNLIEKLLVTHYVIHSIS